MHQKDLCLCPLCIARVSVHDSEREAHGKAWFEVVQAARSEAEPMAQGVVKRGAKVASAKAHAKPTVLTIRMTDDARPHFGGAMAASLRKWAANQGAR